MTKNKVDPICEQFGRKMRKKRRDQDLSQENLAEKCDLDPSYLSSIERGLRNVPLKTIVRIAKALKCRPGDLMPD